MKKSTLALVLAAVLAPTYAQAMGMDNLKISGFGSVGIGIADNDVGYAGHTEELDFKRDTLMGLQFDFQVNDKASFTTQIVANGRYNFEPAVEVAYLSYDLDGITLNAGKQRTPFFMYSDYLDVGYAYPMLRPTEEIYNHINISSYTGLSATIPFNLGGTILQVSPMVGVSAVEERDASFGSAIEIKDVFGLESRWFVNDWTFRAAYIQGNSQENIEGDNVILPLLEDKKAHFAAIGAQYNNGQLLFNIEGIEMGLEGYYTDIEALNVLIGYQIGAVTPYIAASTMNAIDADDRRGVAVPGTENVIPGGIPTPEILVEPKRWSASVGVRWDFAPKLAFKMDVTHSDFRDTTGVLNDNLTVSATGFAPAFEDVTVYSASIDFVF